MCSGPIAAVTALVSLALLLSGCGEEGAATATGEKGATSAARTTPGGVGTPSSAAAGASGARQKPSAAVKRCRAELGDFLDSIESLGNTLAVGLDYGQYLSSVNRVRASYAEVAAERLGIVCLSRVAAPAERALNVHIDAANEWGNCLASSSCDPESIEAKLQRQWERAAGQLAHAQDGLRDLS